MRPIWTIDWRVAAHQVGPGRIATLPALLDLLQVAAQEHARHLGLGYRAMQDKGLVWVLNQMEVQLGHETHWLENIQLQTWIQDFNGVRTSRAFRICNDKGDIVLEALYRWVAIDIEHRRPVRIDSLSVNPPIPESGLSPLPFPRRLPLVSPEDPFYTSEVRYNDLDMVEHLNHVALIRKVLNAYTPEKIPSLTGLAAHYKGEAHWGDPLALYQHSTSSSINDLTMYANNHPIARIQLHWHPDNNA
ncbi:MAG: acyl-ACP thioesterase domain-containing protein [Bacteroidota bacterium]